MAYDIHHKKAVPQEYSRDFILFSINDCMQDRSNSVKVKAKVSFPFRLSFAPHEPPKGSAISSCPGEARDG